MSFVLLMAQAAAAATPEAVAQQGVISYRPEFFASFRPANAFEMIERVPGFVFEGGDEVRGFEGAAGNVLIDGQRPAAKSDTLEQILRRVPASGIERIELIRGGAPGIDMQGKTVLVNVVRKPGGTFRGLLAVATQHVVDDGRTLPAMRLEGSGGAGGGRTWEAGLFYGTGVDDGVGDGPRVRVGPNGQPLIRSRVESEGTVAVQANITGALETPLAGGKLRVNGRLFHDEFNFDEQNYLLFPTVAKEFDQWGQDTQELELGARYNRPLGARANVEVIGLQRNRDRHFGETFRAPGTTVLFALDRQTGESIGRAVLKYRHADQLALEAGAEGAFNWLESETDFVQDGVVQSLPAANVRVEETRGEVFAKATWQPAPGWTFEGGVRQEASKIESTGDVALGKTLYFTKPRFVATWAPDAQTQVRVRVQREVGQLNFDDFVASTDFNTGGGVKAGNPDLEPEQAWVAEAAFERRFWTSGAVVLTVRHFELSDAIDRAPVFASNGDVFDSPANIGDGLKQELALNVTLPFDRLGWKGALLRGEGTWRHSRVTDPTTGEKRQISGLRPLSWEASFTHDLPQWGATWGVSAFGAWRQTYYKFNEVEVQKLKTFMNVFVDLRPRPDIAIRAELQNVTERGFRNTRYVYSGLRGSSPLAYTDDRDIQFGRMVYVRVRKTLGS